MSVLEHRQPWTFEELAGLPATGERYEVVDGNLVVTPPPSHRHQDVTNAIAFELHRLCPPEWRVRTEYALVLGTDGRVPDVSVVRVDAPRTGSERYPVGPEAFGLVVEVVSPRSRKTDRFLKPGEYAEAGIPLYWRVELEPEVQVLSFELVEGEYAPTSEPRAPWGPVSLDFSELLR